MTETILYEAVIALYRVTAEGIEKVDTIGLTYGDGYHTLGACWASAVRFSNMLIESGAADLASQTCRLITGA